MINFPSFNTAATVAFVLLVLGTQLGSLPASANETLIAPTLAARYLEDVEEKRTSALPWKLEVEALGEDGTWQTDYQIRKSNNFDDSVEVNPRSQQWKNLNSGDLERGTVRIKIVKF